MANLKAYLQENLKPLAEYLKKREEQGLRAVYNEDERPDDVVRIWISYDIDNDEDKSRHQLLYDWLNELHAESWGDSAATFTWKIDCEPTNELVARWIVEDLIKNGSLKGKTFKDNEWQKTKDISLYVFYRYKCVVNKEEKRNSNHFVLIQNAEIRHSEGF